MSVKILGPKDGRDPAAINTTSSSKNWSRGLSPFFLGPCQLYRGLISLNMENAWQYSKVYPSQVDAAQEPTEDYWSWARSGWAREWADRYPTGRGARPLYSLWDNEKLGYIEARKAIYLPLYQAAVCKSSAWEQLKRIYQKEGRVTLWDFDGYDYQSLGMSLDEVLNHPERKMGHAFVLAMMLEGKI